MIRINLHRCVDCGGKLWSGWKRCPECQVRTYCNFNEVPPPSK